MISEKNIPVLSQLIKALEYHVEELKKAYDKKDIENFEQAKKNVLYAHAKINDIEKEIIREIVFYNEMIKSARSMNEQKLIAFALNSLQRQFCILNDAIPALVDNISTSSALPPASPAQKRADAKPREDRLVSISYKDHDMQKKGAVIRNADKERFVKELGISEELIKKLKARQKTGAETGRKEVRIRVNVYAKLANRFFSGMTSRLIAKGYFRNISIELK